VRIGDLLLENLLAENNGYNDCCQAMSLQNRTRGYDAILGAGNCLDRVMKESNSAAAAASG
jgi:hypothetical protein